MGGVGVGVWGWVWVWGLGLLMRSSRIINCSPSYLPSAQAAQKITPYCSSPCPATTTAQHSTAQHSTAQHSTAQHSTAQRSPPPLTASRRTSTHSWRKGANFLKSDPLRASTHAWQVCAVRVAMNAMIKHTRYVCLDRQLVC